MKNSLLLIPSSYSKDTLEGLPLWAGEVWGERAGGGGGGGLGTAGCGSTDMMLQPVRRSRRQSHSPLSVRLSVCLSVFLPLLASDYPCPNPTSCHAKDICLLFCFLFHR
jgi:hypothetical protein